MKTSALPTHVGTIPLRKSDFWELPKRTPEGGISLPFNQDMVFTLIKGGEQFVVYSPFERHRRGGFFGGMDESPFITPISDIPISELLMNGEQAFFNSLIPSEIKLLEKRLSVKARRQGDIWSIDLGTTWKSLFSTGQILTTMPQSLRWPTSRQKRRKVYGLYKKQAQRAAQRGVVPAVDYGVSSVLGTNHTITGHYLKPYLVRMFGTSFNNTAIAEGILSATDHADQHIAGAPHILVRTPHMLSVSESEQVLLGWD